jgi:hypothetical protein
LGVWGLVVPINEVHQDGNQRVLGGLKEFGGFFRMTVGSDQAMCNRIAQSEFLRLEVFSMAAIPIPRVFRGRIGRSGSNAPRLETANDEEMGEVDLLLLDA